MASGGGSGGHDYSEPRTGRGVTPAVIKALTAQVEKRGHILEKEMVTYVLEDTRLSTLQRKLIKEADVTVATALSLYINDCIAKSENATYITRSSDTIQDAILEVIQSPDHSMAVKQICCIGLGRVGCLHQNYSKWGSTIWKLMENAPSDRMKALYTDAFVESIKWRGRGHLDGIPALLGLTKSKLEETQSEFMVVALLGVMNAIAEEFPEVFGAYFTEVVDIAVGWFMESQNLPDVRMIIGKYIMDWTKFWKEEVEFAVDQITFYIEDLLLETRTGGTDEDLASLDEEDTELLKCFEYKWSSSEYDYEEKEKSQTQALAFIQMVECVLTGILHTPPERLEQAKFGVWIQILHNVTRASLEWRWSEDVAIGGLKCMMTAMDCIARFNPGQKQGMETLVVELLCYIAERWRRLSAVGQRVLISVWMTMTDSFSPDSIILTVKRILSTAFMHRVIESSHPEVQLDAVALVQRLLQSKNVHILQETYLSLLTVYDPAICYLADIPPLTASSALSADASRGGTAASMAAKKRVLFFLACIRDIATTKASVLSLWALEPSIFQVLSNHSGLESSRLPAAFPAIYQSVMKLFQLHCTAHSFFVSSSNLLGTGAVTESPTSGHFENILRILTCVLNSPTASRSSKQIAQEIFYAILESVQSSQTEVFLGSRSLYNLYSASVKASLSVPELLNEQVRVNLLLVDFPHLPLDILVNIAEVVLHIIKSGSSYLDESSRARILRIFSKVPANLIASERPVGGVNHELRPLISDVLMLEKLILRDPEPIPIKLNIVDVRDFLLSICGSPEKVWRDVADFELQFPSFGHLKGTWIAWFVAQFCVDNKLKSPLGKAQDTLGHIDAAARKLGHPVMNLTSPAPVKPIDRQQLYHMVKMVEWLEKWMVNAWDGSAGLLQQPSKSASLFFFANKKTCNDWLERLRLHIMRVAFLAGNYQEVVRHSWSILPNLMKRKDLESTGGFAVLFLTCLSMLKLKAYADIRGLYKLLKDNLSETFPQPFQWLLGLSEYARGLLERSATSLEQSLDVLKDSQQQQGKVKEEHSQLFSFLGEVKWRVHCDMMEHNAYVSLCHSHNQQVEGGDNGAQVDRLGEAQSQYLETLSSFQDGCISSSAGSMLVPEGFCFNSSVARALDNIHANLLKAGLQIQSCYMKSNSNWYDNVQLTSSLNIAYDTISDLLKAPHLIKEEKQMLFVFSCIWQEIINIKTKGGSQTTIISQMNVDEDDHDISSTILNTIKMWSEFFNRYKKANSPDVVKTRSDQLKKLSLLVGRRARQEGNLGLAIKTLLPPDNGSQASVGDRVFAIAKEFQLLTNMNSPQRIMTMKLMREVAEIVFEQTEEVSTITTTDKQLAVAAIAGVVLRSGESLISRVFDQCGPQLLIESSRTLLVLTRKLQEDNLLFQSVYPQFERNHEYSIIQMLIMEGSLPVIAGSLQKTIPISKIANEHEVVIGRLLRLCVLQDPSHKQAWKSLADWSYALGELEVNSAEKGNNRVELNQEEVLALIQLLPSHISSDQKTVEEIMAVISQIKLKDSHLAGYEYEKWDFMRKELLEISALSTLPDANFQGVVKLWRSVFRRVYAFYDLAGEAYFRYLVLCGAEEESPAARKISDASKSDAATGGGGGNKATAKAGGTISATLRLLHLTVQHTLDLEDMFQLAFSTTPCSQWKAIIPQLFSRLNHPVPVVRQRISDLLCRISQTYPQLIIFPAVVGSLTKGSQTTQTLNNIFTGSLLTSKADSQDTNMSEEGSANNESETTSSFEMISAHAKIVEALKKQSEGAIEQVTLLVSELRRIALLWDELWLGTLLQCHGEIQLCIKRFKKERDRLDSNPSLNPMERLKLTKDKYNIIFTPFVYVLEQVTAITHRVEPETPHEEAFQRKFGKMIIDILEIIKNPSNWEDPCDGWRVSLNQLKEELFSKLNKKNVALRLAEISPGLQALKNTEIVMPGEENKDKERRALISRFEGTMVVLPSKTKPKKFSMIGDNGQRYTYLFKGLEDLHLDERIMQFLNIANEMMKHSNARSTFRCARIERGKYFARHYRVIPLGPRSGLIQWVPGAQPFYSLYKKWQLRQQQHLENAKKTEEAQKIVSKPSDAFYSKLLPMLKKHGITKMDDRKSWPTAIMKQVLEELIQETPSDLLSKEIWLRSVTGEQWWTLSQTLGRSLAVMSVIGYIIGLGDRHLDNILININTGNIVHIDYNVSFEKGRKLRIPERVPFRLTQNIVSVYGAAGVDGLFRYTCEDVLSALRQERETLITLLETFVYDPLVDWTPGLGLGLAGAMYGGGMHGPGMGGGGDDLDRRDLEHNMTLSMLGVRVAEMRSAWQVNHQDLLAGLIQIEELWSNWLELDSIVSKRSETLAGLHRNMSMLKEAEANPNHNLHFVLDKYREQKCVEDEFETVRKAVEVFLSECDKMAALNARATASISGGHQLTKWGQEVHNLVEQSHVASRRTVAVFLENAGQRELLTQYENLEVQLTSRLKGLAEAVKRILEQLNKYRTVTNVFPSWTAKRHRVSLYSGWCRRLLDADRDALLEVNRSIAIELNDLRTGVTIYPSQTPGQAEILTQHIRVVNLQLEQWHSEMVATTQRLYHRMINEGVMTKTGRGGSVGALDDVNKHRDTILNQLNHPNSGVQPDTIIVFFMLQLVDLDDKWLETEAGINEAIKADLDEPPGGLQNAKSKTLEPLVEQYYIQAGVACTILDTMDMLNIKSSTNDKEKISTGSHGAAECLEGIRGVCRALHLLEKNYATIVLPEGIKKFLQPGCATGNTEGGVLDTMQKLKDMVHLGQEQGISVKDILFQIRDAIGCSLTNDSPASFPAKSTVVAMRTRMSQLLTEAGNADTMAPGQMLLCAFNSLCDKVDVELENLRNIMLGQNDAINWSEDELLTKLMANRAKGFLCGPHTKVFTNPEVWSLVHDYIFVNKLRMFATFMGMCGTLASSLTAETVGQGMVANTAALMRPVRRYIADLMQLVLLQGRLGPHYLAIAVAEIAVKSASDASALAAILEEEKSALEGGDNAQQRMFPLEKFCKVINDEKVASGALNQARIAKCRMLTKNICSAIHRWQLGLQLEAGIEMQVFAQQTQTLLHASLQWLYEEVLGLYSGETVKLAELARLPFLAELQAAGQSIVSLQGELASLVVGYGEVRAGVDQRLRWAVGANPQLQQTVDQFVSEHCGQVESVKLSGHLVKSIHGVIQAILQYEMLRTNSAESRAADQRFLELLTRMENFATLAASQLPMGISDEEKSLLDLNPPKEAIDPFWIRQTEELIANNVRRVQELLTGSNAESISAQKRLLENGKCLKDLIGQQQKLMSDVSMLLRTIAKMDQLDFPGVTAYLNRYKEFSDHMQSLTKLISPECIRVDNNQTFTNLVDGLRIETPFVYDELLKIAALAKDENFVQDLFKSRKALKDEEAKNQVTGDKDKQADPNSAAKKEKNQVEEKNLFAMNVLRRVRMKLEGKEPDSLKTSSVEDQVDFIIKEASNMDNLALMYEGWTAWI